MDGTGRILALWGRFSAAGVENQTGVQGLCSVVGGDSLQGSNFDGGCRLQRLALNIASVLRNPLSRQFNSDTSLPLIITLFISCYSCFFYLFLSIQYCFMCRTDEFQLVCNVTVELFQILFKFWVSDCLHWHLTVLFWKLSAGQH